MTSHLGVAVEIETPDGARHRVRVARRSGFVVGDDVEVEGDLTDVRDGALHGARVHPLARRSSLLRRSAGGGVHVVAANLDVLGIVAAVDPPARAGLVDRAAVAARAGGITPVLIVNKVDLEDAAEVVAAQRERVAGEFEVFAVSATSGEGLEALGAYLAARGRAALIGPSGVGKSSLMNRLAPDAQLATRTLSDATGAGRHTTTVSTLWRLRQGGELVDTPGVREYGLVDVTPHELSHYFPGFSVVTTACRFRDCLHADEPGCAILEAVDDDRIAASRYVAYRTLLDELRGA